MSRRLEWSIALVALAGLVLLRAMPFAWWPSIDFDSDQAIVGLMAKHIREGRAFPLYFYGQSYMLAVEAWLAAPVMAVAGATVTALKAPLVIINLAAVLLLLRALVIDLGLRPALAAVASLPLAVPPAAVAARVMEANGGNVEPWLYVILLWMLRARPWAFGIVLGIGSAQREFTLYGAAALLAVEIAQGIVRGDPAGSRLARKWTVIIVATLAARTVIATIEPFANPYGPGTAGNEPDIALTADPVGNRVCFAPDRWWERTTQLAGDHLPRLVGGKPAALNEYGVLSGVPSGFAGVAPIVAVLILAGVIAGVRSRHLPTAAFGWYLVGIGALSTLAYGYAICSPIQTATLRYNLLGLMAPAGAIALALAVPGRGPFGQAARAGVAGLTILWCALNLSDVSQLTREYATNPPVDHRQITADALERRGITSAFSDYRTAYHVTFLAQERVRLTADDYIRIREYWTAAVNAGAPVVSSRACDTGEALTPRVYLCPR